MDFWERVNALPPGDRERFLAWTERVMIRTQSLTEHDTPTGLAASLDPGYVVTPALTLIGKELEHAATTPDSRLMISVPPQEGKSSLACIWFVIRCLQRNPDTRILLASYSLELAQQQSAACKRTIDTYGSNAVDPITRTPLPDRLGIGIAPEKSAEANWRIDGYKGGVFAVGLTGSITGKPADLIIIDDPLKGHEAADSKSERTKIVETYRSDVLTRLAPGAPLIIIQTRWHEEDLAGTIQAEEAKRDPEDQEGWRIVNIPARAEPGLPDALDRPDGEWLESARGRTPKQWHAKMIAVGGEDSRTWTAIYLGRPVPRTGGMFKHAWFDQWRLGVEPVLHRRVVAIDPADTAKGDVAGIIGAGIDSRGNVCLTHDRSGHYTSDQWAYRGVLLLLQTGASRILFEAYQASATYERVIKQAYLEIRKQAAKELDLEPWTGEDDADPRTIEWNGITLTPRRPFVVQPWTGAGNAVYRATGLQAGCANGRARLVQHRMAEFENDACGWLVHQHCPDRVSAAVVAFEHLAGTGGITLSGPGEGGTWGQMEDGL